MPLLPRYWSISSATRFMCPRSDPDFFVYSNIICQIWFHNITSLSYQNTFISKIVTKSFNKINCNSLIKEKSQIRSLGHKIFYFLTGVVVAWMYYVILYWMVHTCFMHFSVWMLQHNRFKGKMKESKKICMLLWEDI